MSVVIAVVPPPKDVAAPLFIGLPTTVGLGVVGLGVDGPLAELFSTGAGGATFARDDTSVHESLDVAASVE